MADSRPLKCQRQMDSNSLEKDFNNSEVELPDDIFLLVFSLLPTLDLLRGPRGVSRSWRHLALHSSLWRGRELTNVFCPWLRAALRLAPCAKWLILGMCDMSPAIWRCAAESACAVKEIRTGFFHRDVVSLRAPLLRHFRALLQSQVRLGQLRTVSVRLPKHAVREFIGILSGANLTELRVHVSTDENSGSTTTTADDSAPVPEPAQSKSGGCSSLRTLSYLSSSEDPALDFLLRAHAATLQSAQAWLPRCTAPSSTVRLLGACALLQRAALPLCGELSVLAGCQQLRGLTVTKAAGVPEDVPLGFFRGFARQLTSLCLGTREVPFSATAVMAVLGALSESGRSAVRVLIVSVECDSAELEGLRAVLRGLPHLRSLLWFCGEGPPRHLLRAIDSAPRLRVLRLSKTGNLSLQSPPCVATCWYPGVLRLARRVPWLHVMGLPRYHRHDSADQQAGCNCCRRGLHAPFVGPPHEFAEAMAALGRQRECGVFAHPPEQRCGLAEHTSDAIFWMSARVAPPS